MFQSHSRDPIYVKVADSLPDRIPRSQQRNVEALLAHEEDRLSSQPSPRHAMDWLLSYYQDEIDPGVYVLFADGEKQGFNNRRAMGRFITQQRENAPGQSILVHRMGSPVDLELVNKLDVRAEEEPHRWVSRRVERASAEGGVVNVDEPPSS